MSWHQLIKTLFYNFITYLLDVSVKSIKFASCLSRNGR